MSEDRPFASVAVSADKPGRRVEIDVSQGMIPDRDNVRKGDLAAAAVTLSIESVPPIMNDTWTWLSPDEARQVADALVKAADQADEQNARDPREG